MYCCKPRAALTLRRLGAEVSAMDRRPTTTASADSRIFGLYRDFASLCAGVNNLKALRFRNNDISILFPEVAVSKGFSPNQIDSSYAESDSAPFIGGTLGWLTYVRPERVGIVSAALANLGVPEGEADLYEGLLRRGHLLVCVRSSVKNNLEAAMKAVRMAGAERVIAVRASSRRNRNNGIDTLELPLDAHVSPAALVS